jgi:hypothetical protein
MFDLRDPIYEIGEGPICQSITFYTYKRKIVVSPNQTNTSWLFGQIWWGEVDNKSLLRHP